ncbi:uncharacterized protein F4812DRAFT_150720 [Daldinia caldariorum]|uniref:uncharacterized protein n=1 Tax=Daldinia caldariorum TaxID=326644 RepID=UPI002007AD78|nr:uncharacterized protein F4812DRAFT_150720 [Daldinia caldariorum]KAI1464690.1 hypothetical protein F4812DRAFT_150720 [Daldinia caldariorum]
MVAILGDMDISGEPPIYTYHVVPSALILTKVGTDSDALIHVLSTHGQCASARPQVDRLGNALVLQSTYSYNIVIIVIGVNADAVIRRLSKTLATRHAHGDPPSLS